MFLFAVLAAATVGAIVVAVKSAQKRKQRWAQAAETLGFSMDPGPRSSRKRRGSLDSEMFVQREEGQEVYIGIYSISKGSGSTRSTTFYTYVDVFFSRSLHLALEVGNEKTGFWASPSADLQLGHAAADQALRLRARDPDEARALLLPTLWGKLAQTMATRTVYFNDERVCVERKSTRLSDVPSLKELLAEAEGLHRQILVAFEKMPESAHAETLASSWPQAASAHQATYRVADHQITRQTPNWSLQIRDVLENSLWTTRVELKFLVPISEFELRFETTGAKVKKFFGAQDIEIANSEFDSLFVIKGVEEEIRGLLSSEVQDALLQFVHGLGESIARWKCNQEGIEVDLKHSSSEPEEVAALLTNASKVCQHVVRDLENTNLGPYR